MLTQDRAGETNPLLHHIGKRDGVDLGCARVCAPSRQGVRSVKGTPDHCDGVHVWPLEITKREKFKFDI